MCAVTMTALVAVAGGPGTAPLPAHAEIPPHLGYGINVRQESSIDPLVAPLGFEWLKLWEEYEGDPPTERLPYQILFAIECNGMPADLDQWGDDVEAIATAGLGFVEAYEIGNEPNTDRFWDNGPPDPGQYVQVLQVAYGRIKAVDPAAIVVSAGLAPVGRIEGDCNGWSGNNCEAMDEREFACQMFLLGAGEHFDAFGYHPYGFAYAPERALDELPPDDNGNGFAFRGAEVMHDLLEQHNLGHKPVWATEFNWLRDWTEDGGMPSDCLDKYDVVFGWMEVPGETQADYLVDAFKYADENWPWMGAMFVWNLDWHNYHTWDCEAARYFSVLKVDYTTYDYDPCGGFSSALCEAPVAYNAPSAPYTTTLAYDALAEMEKRPGHFGPRLAVEPSSLTFLADVDEPGVFTATLAPLNTGYRVLTWTATVAAGMPLTPTLVITTGLQGTPLTVMVDSTGYPTGTFTGSITVTATTTDVLDAPQVVPVTLLVVPEVYRVYLPVALRSAP